MKSQLIQQTLWITLAAAFLKQPIVQTGLDILIESQYSQLAGRKVLVLSNPTGVTPQLDLGVDVMAASGSVQLVGVMGPEHGFRGTSQNGGGELTFTDVKTGLTVYVSVLCSPDIEISTRYTKRA